MISAGKTSGVTERTPQPLTFDMRLVRPVKKDELSMCRTDDKSVFQLPDKSELAWLVKFKKNPKQSGISRVMLGDDPSPRAAAGEKKTFNLSVRFMKMEPRKDVLDTCEVKPGRHMGVSATNQKDSRHTAEIRVPVQAGVTREEDQDEGYMVLYVSPHHAKMIETQRKKGFMVAAEGHPVERR